MRKIMDGIWNMDQNIDLNYHDPSYDGDSYYYFLDYTNSPDEIKSSVSYVSMEAALQAYRNHKIQWED